MRFDRSLKEQQMARRSVNKPTNARGPGQPRFEPTTEQCGWVRATAGLKMTWDEMRLLVINPRTGKPISKETLGKAFAAELAVGKVRLKQLISTKYLERLNAGDTQAIQFGFRHIFGWPEQAPNRGSDGAHRDGNTSIKISFVPPKANGHLEQT
jgi:hypothetical protein